jgi:hypothetical protein
MGRSRRKLWLPEAPRQPEGDMLNRKNTPTDRIAAHFSWRAPGNYFPVETEGSRQQVARRIEEDARRLLVRHPGLEALAEHYNIPEATRFWLGEEPLPPKVPSPDIPGIDLYQIDVRVEGQLFRKLRPLQLFAWKQREVWDEICERSDLLGHPDRFEVCVNPL